MQLQQFVTEIVEELGGVVEPIEYALCQVLVPENYAAFFQNKTEFELAFDFEVAQENPDSEFVTFGSYILEQLLTIVHRKATSTLRFAEIERLELGNSEKKITKFLENEQGKPTIIESRPELGVWAVFQFEITYVSDEKVGATEQVWINLLTNEICPTMKQEQNRIIYKQEPLYTYPIAAPVELSVAFKKATEYVNQMAEKSKASHSNDIFLEKDVNRISDYYKDLLAENEKKSTRKGLSLTKQKELAEKSVAIGIERDKQLQEIYNKYTSQIEINLDNGILYFIPLLKYTVDLQFRGKTNRKIIFYNPITKRLEA